MRGVAIALVALGFCLGVPASASAGIFGVYAANSAEDPVDEIAQDDALYALGYTDLGGGQVCVIPASYESSPDDSLSCDDIGVGWASPNQVTGIGFFDIPIQGPPLRVGTWRLLGDGQCLQWNDDKCLTRSADAVSAPFTITSCEPDCDPSPALQKLASWKAWAGGDLGTATTLNCVMGTVYDKFSDFSGHVKNYRSARRVGDWAEDQIEDKSELLGDVAEEGIAIVGMGFMGFALPDFPVPTSYNDAAYAMALDIVCKQNKMLDDIKADPPKPGYEEVAPPQFENWPTSHDALGDRLIAASEAVHAHGRAQLAAVERYQGALADDKPAYEHLQAGAIAAEGDELALAIRRMARELERYRDLVAATPEGSEPMFTDADVAKLSALYQRVRASGFTADELGQLQGLGLTPAMIDLYRSTYDRKVEDLPVGRSEADVLTDLLEALQQSEGPVQGISNEAAGTALANNLPPDASFVLAPSAGPSPLAVAVTDTSTNPDLDAQTVSWDFGDGGFGAGPSATHTYLADGEYTVTQTVSDGYASVQSAKTVTVGVPNQPPTASFTATPTSGVAPLQVDFDASGSSDPDGGVASYAWTFGDGDEGTGDKPSHTYTSPGTYTVELTVIDGKGASASTSKTITVTSSGQAPTAKASATPTSGASPLKVDFDGSGSSDPDGSVVSYHWEFGDGASGDGAKVGHTYADAGGFHPTLVVTDNDGLSASDTVAIEVTKGSHAPEPVDDALAAEGAGALDVLENDADPDKDALRVVATGAPAHGTASCTALGACLYTPTAGYAGPDSFTYRVADPEGLEATATVAVEVTTAPAASTLVARADHAATRQGTPVTVHVLGNDSGTGLHLTDSTDPAHGTVACEDDGDCVYTPSAGYSGDDGFSYTVANADADQRSADVEIAVAPSTAGYGVTVSGAPAAASKAGLVEGQGASWGAAVAPAPAGVTDEALAALPLPAVTAALDGAHVLKPSSVRTARGWTAEPAAAGARTLHAKAGSDALLGEVSDAIPRPLPAIGQGTGGDGHVPILVGSKVFAFFHHSSPTQVTCVDRATGSLCPGYPKTLNQATTNIPGPAVVVGTRIYVHLSAMQFAAQRTAQALYCWDTAKDRTCGLIVVDRLERQYAYASPPVQIGGKMYFGGDGGRLYCVDPATNASCAVASLPTGLGPDANEYDIVGHGSRVYLGRLDGLTACLDVTAGGPCPGWALPRQLAGPNLVTHHNTAGTADGVCSIAQGAGQCYTDSAPAAAIPVTGWPGTEDYYAITAEAEIGKRTLMAAHGRGGLGCWDWTTMAPCTGGDYVDGWIDHDTQAETLPMAYGAAYDGSCVVGLGDPGLIFTVDPTGHAPCTSLGAGTEPRTIDLRDQRCDNTVGGATWRELALADSAPGELAGVTVTVRDAATGALLATKDIAGSKLDLSGIDPKAHPAITVAANAISTSGDPAWADSVPPRIRVAWKADPRQLCFETTTKVACASPLAPIGVTASIDGSAAKDEETLDVVRGACPAKPTPTPTPTPTPNAGGTLGNAQQSSAADLVRACTSRGVVLEDVIPAGNRVKLLGVAEERFKGRRVDIVFAATGKVVARPKVGTDGSFSATAPMPPRRLRFSNRARYQARVGGERSLNLKLMRRMLVTSVRTSAGKVTIAGKVVGPLALRAKDREIVLERRVTCTRLATVSRFKPRSNGAFKVTVPVPAGTSAAVYRLRTKVRASTHGSRLSSTFTLPRAIGFR